MPLLISGSLAYDYIMDFPDAFKNHIMPDQIHILNVCFVVDRLQKSWGGTGGSIAYNAKLLGDDPMLISALGQDGQEYLTYLEKLNISTAYIARDPKRLTASAYITTDNEDNQITAFYGGPLDLAQTIKLPLNSPALKVALISPNHKEVMIKHLNDCAGAGNIKVVFDPGQQITAFSSLELQKLVSRSDFVIGNDYEIKLLQERTGWDRKKLLGETDTLITTLGEHGSIVDTSAGEHLVISACPPRSCDDPTGAGDAFRAGFFVGYQKNLDLKTCAQIGATTASYAVETYGTQAHHFTKKEFSERYEKTYREKITL